MTEYGILVLGIVTHEPWPYPRWLKSYDANGSSGKGTWSFTDDPNRALRFPDKIAAAEAWKQQSQVRPIRPWDGQPNRPLTRFTVLIQEVTDEQQPNA